MQRTYIAQLRANFPYTCLIQRLEVHTVFSKKSAEVAQFTKLRLNIEHVVLLPTVDVFQNIRVTALSTR